MNDTYLEFYNYWSDINSSYENYARELGISYALLHVLCELYQSDQPLTQKELCLNCHLPKTTINAIISKLHKQNHITFIEIEEDKRKKGIILTDKGKQYSKPIVERMIKSERNAFQKLDKEKRKIMLECLKDYHYYFELYLNSKEEDNE